MSGTEPTTSNKALPLENTALCIKCTTRHGEIHWTEECIVLMSGTFWQ